MSFIKFYPRDFMKLGTIFNNTNTFTFTDHRNFFNDYRNHGRNVAQIKLCQDSIVQFDQNKNILTTNKFIIKSLRPYEKYLFDYVTGNIDPTDCVVDLGDCIKKSKSSDCVVDPSDCIEKNKPSDCIKKSKSIDHNKNSLNNCVKETKSIYFDKINLNQTNQINQTNQTKNDKIDNLLCIIQNLYYSDLKNEYKSLLLEYIKYDSHFMNHRPTLIGHEDFVTIYRFFSNKYIIDENRDIIESLKNTMERDLSTKCENENLVELENELRGRKYLNKPRLNWK